MSELLTFALLLSGISPPVITHGVAVGEVMERSAVVWARADRDAEMVVVYGLESGEAQEARSRAEEARDFTARVELAGLEPGRLYRYRVRFEASGEASESLEGSFRTAPLPSSAEPIRFVVGGDLGGHGFCREEKDGYAIFAAMRELQPHFFVANGDMIYGDSECPPERPDGGRNLPGSFPSIDDPELDWKDEAKAREVYLAHWRYNRADPHFQSFLRETPVYVQWDDHEVINDFGAGWARWAPAREREGFPSIVRAGRSAFFDFHPLAPHPADPDRIYRSFRWGAPVELYLLDARSYRSENDRPDAPRGGKTLLGREQLDWLKRGLAASSATWKIVSSDVPLSIATGSRAEIYGRDAFADGDPPDGAPRTGSETELRELLLHLDRENVENLLFVVTDVHFAANLRYEIDLDGDGEALVFHEVVSGPLSAGLVEPRAPDATFSPQVLYSEGGVFNFAFLRIEGSRLISEIRDREGTLRPGSSLELTAAR